MTYMVLSVLHLALLVTTAVQLVQGDRLVGTTAFWLTRPVSRGALLASKLGLAFALLVAGARCPGRTRRRRGPARPARRAWRRRRA